MIHGHGVRRDGHQSMTQSMGSVGSYEQVEEGVDLGYLQLASGALEIVCVWCGTGSGMHSSRVM